MKTQFNFAHSDRNYPAAGSITFPDFPGYTVTVEYDEIPQNPFEAWDGEPPLASFSERWVGPTAEDVFECIPEAVAAKRYKDILAAVGEYVGDHEGTRYSYASNRRSFGESRHDALRDAVREAYEPTGWRSAEDYIELLETLASIAGIAYLSRVSRGYSQGDAARLFTFASPAWVELTGAPEDTHAAQLSAACDLWTAWAWGDVYGIAEITGPDGEEIENDNYGSIWGFYGSDHDASGLVDAALETIHAHERYLAREAEAAHDAACRDIATVTA